MTLDARLDRGQLNPLVHADLLARQVGRQDDAAAWTLVGDVADRLGNLVAQSPAVASCLGLAPLGRDLLPALLAVCLEQAETELLPVWGCLGWRVTKPD